MGSFAWLKADTLTKVKNVPYGHPFKFLIPKEFGGGFIKDHYRDYGDLGNPTEQVLQFDKWAEGNYDMYELLALWNCPERCQYDGEFNPMKPVDKYTDKNRLIGIEIGCYDEEVDKLKYPLKLVSCSFRGDYESCEGKSYTDDEQGCLPVYR